MYTHKHTIVILISLMYRWYIWYYMENYVIELLDHCIIIFFYMYTETPGGYIGGLRSQLTGTAISRRVGPVFASGRFISVTVVCR